MAKSKPVQNFLLPPGSPQDSSCDSTPPLCESMPLLLPLHAASPVTQGSSSCDCRPLLLQLQLQTNLNVGFFICFLGNHYRFIAKREAAWSSWRISLQSQEELGGVTGEVARSHRRSGRESQEESCRDLGGAPWSSEFCTGLFLAI